MAQSANTQNYADQVTSICGIPKAVRLKFSVSQVEKKDEKKVGRLCDIQEKI